MKLDLGYTKMIIEECLKQGLLRNQCAYVLATAYHETAYTMKPVREYGGENYLRKKKYYPYVGMGFVQLTWKENYVKAGKVLGVDFVKNPSKLLQPEYSAVILVKGMKEGWFTTRKLSDYITLQKSDFVGARKIVNGTDKAATIASYALEYDKDLQAYGYGLEQPQEPVQTVPDVPSGSTPAKTPSGWTSLIDAIVLILTNIFGRKK